MTPASGVFVEVAAVGVESGFPVSPVKRSVREAVRAAREGSASSLPSVEVSVQLTGDERMRAINRDQRGVDSPTDVLAFPQLNERELAELFRGRVPPGFPPAPVPLGDLVINVEEAGRTALRRGGTVVEEVALLAVHGCLHLLGFDHDRESAAARMNQAADRALSAMGLTIRHGV